MLKILPSGNVRKNHPLCHEGIRWKSDVPLTEGQLRSKRDEFWDTAPAFDGRKEIWDALRAAAIAGESKDYEHAQAILDGANISVPNGFLTECYDELGTCYQVPVYCLSYPINIVEEDGRDSPGENAVDVESGTECTLKLRLSTSCTDVKLVVNSNETVGMAKKRLFQQLGNSDINLEPSGQRWYFGGKLLVDKMRISETKIQPGYVIQVIYNEIKQE